MPIAGSPGVANRFPISGFPIEKFVVQYAPAHLRRIEPFIGNNVTHPFVSTLLPTWLEWTQTNRPRVLEFCVSIESVEWRFLIVPSLVEARGLEPLTPARQGRRADKAGTLRTLANGLPERTGTHRQTSSQVLIS